MNWLVVVLAIELGFLPKNNFLMYQQPEYVCGQTVYVQFEAEFQFFKYIFIGGEIETYCWPKNNKISFWPSRAGCMFNTGLRYKILELGFRHYCTHPIIPYQYPVQMNWEGGYEEIYLRIEGKLNE